MPCNHNYPKSLIAAFTLALYGCGDNTTETTNTITKPTLAVEMVARYASGQYGVSAAEIVDYHPATRSVLVVNAQSGKVDILDAGVITTTGPNHSLSPKEMLTLHNLTKKAELDLAQDLALTGLGSVNSVAVHHNLIAVAIERADKQGNKVQGRGFIGFYQMKADGTTDYLAAVEVGFLPDNVVFNRDGTKVLVANEGEPNPSYNVDPEGSISIIPIHNGIPDKTAKELTFKDFNRGKARYNELPSGLKINGPGATVAQDLEPEYISVAPDNKRAFVSLQENNGIAVINLATDSIESIIDLGSKDYGLSANALDASDKDNAVNIQQYPGVYGLYQPDTIASYMWQGQPLLVTANEGDARDYPGFSEETRAAKLKLNPGHPQLAAAQNKEQLGRLKVIKNVGDTDNDGDIDKIYNYGARSFSIWNTQGEQLFDSGSDFGRITAERLSINFNNNNSKNKKDSRSDDKGAEPEALTLGQIGKKQYAFIGLERTSGFMIYDITDPTQVRFIDYIVNRDFNLKFNIKDDHTIEGEPKNAGDLGPEGMKFVGANDSPNGQPLLIVANEVSGSTAIYQLRNIL